MVNLSPNNITEAIMNILIILLPIVLDKIFADYLKLPARVLELNPSQERDWKVLSGLLSYFASSLIAILRSILIASENIELLWLSQITVAIVIAVELVLVCYLFAFVTYHRKNPEYFAYKQAIKLTENAVPKMLIFILLISPELIDIATKIIT
jgi:hypothetical protein